MQYRADFSPDAFKWSKSAKKVVEHARKAGKMDDLAGIIGMHFGYRDAPSAKAINDYVSDNRASILRSLGMGLDGAPLKTKMFEVFVRVEGVVSEEVEAETPEEAARKVYADMNDGDPIISLLRSDVDLMKPVAYNDEKGNTKDYPEDFEVEEDT